jgi:UrcA family protein
VFHRAESSRAIRSINAIPEEIHMETKLAAAIARSILCGAAIAGMQFAGTAAAEDHNVTVAIHVSTEGLDLSQTADAQTLYTRLKNAAWVACTRGNRAGLVPVDDVKGCYERALGGAIHSAKAPTLTQVYLVTHTTQEAAVYGINVATQIAGIPPR